MTKAVASTDHESSAETCASLTSSKRGALLISVWKWPVQDMSMQTRSTFSR